MAIELTDFALFLEVTGQGSFSRAAAALRLAQPSVSARMAGLERSIGQELFARSTRGVTLTAAGRALEPYARRCVALAAEGRRSARASAGSRRLVLVSPPSLAATIFPAVISALAAESLEVVCRTAHSREVLEQVLDGTAQAGFLLGTAVPGGLTARRLYRVPIVCVAHRDHPAARPRSLRLGDLAGHRLAVHSWGPGADELAELLHAAGIPAAQVCWVSPAATALTLAVEHGHIAVLPSDAASGRLRDRTLFPVKITDLPKWSLDVALTYRHGFAERENAAVAELLASTVSSRFRAEPSPSAISSTAT
jgi:DNA-binding transcriptional LysR family regulator